LTVSIIEKEGGGKRRLRFLFYAQTHAGGELTVRRKKKKGAGRSRN